MYELIRAAGESYYIDSPVKVGLVRLNEEEVCLIDGGSDRDAGKKIGRILDEKGWRLRAIYNTHSHADHIGGNAYLAGRTGCEIYAPGMECAFTRSPVLEPALLYGGCPPKDLRHKFLLARESEAHSLCPERLPCGFEMIDLPGHSPNMTGFRTPDDVVYLGDCLCSEQTLQKYGISYIYDVGAYLETLQKVQTLRARYFVPAHAGAEEDIAPLARKNIEKVQQIAESIRRICARPQTFETILQKLFEEYALTMNFEQYALVGSTVRSYLSWLRDSGELNVLFDGALMLWEKA